MAVTVTFYSDDSPGATTVDGDVRRSFEDQPPDIIETYSAINTGDGTGVPAELSDSSPIAANITADAVTDRWSRCYKSIMLFDTSNIPPLLSITSAKLYFHVSTHINQHSYLTYINVFGSNPASNVVLVAADYQTIGFSKYATNISIDSLTNGDWSNFVLNAAGLAAINTGGITKLAVAISDFPGTWEGAGKQSFVTFKSADYSADPTKIPYLEVVYNPISPSVSTRASTNVTSTTATLNGDITDIGGENATERGFEWGTTQDTPMANSWTETGDFGTGTFSFGIGTLKSLYAPEVSGTGNAAAAQQAFTAVDCSGLTKADGTLIIDLKCDDPSKLSSNNQIEITSSGGADVNEWHIPAPISEITTGWQTFNLPLASASTTGGELNVAAINFIRWYNFSTDGNITINWRNAQIITSSVLTPGTTYFYRAKAQNSAGWGYGRVRVISTVSHYVFPSNSTTTITEIVHRYTSKNVKHPLTMEVLLGGATQQSITVLSKEPPTLPELTPMPPSAIPVPPPPPLPEPESVFIGLDDTGKEMWLMPNGTIR